MRKKSALSKRLLSGILVLAGIFAVFLIIRSAFFSSTGEAQEVVDEFYGYEQEGDFANSWGLFHSSMKKKFSKGNYIQDRAHVFMNHFGVETFSYTIGELEELKDWKMSKTGPSLKNVYKVPVTQTYKGKYGNFDLEQEVFVTEEKGKWRILWDYNQ
ncbi:hypothetical protein [Neobacillus sp. PS2-9]|uniref:hypothetical protein n=1 Tax=Neobacillus sp. PS2-9 TaxID=3070676 RepID=UPI0027DF24B2|nr:hypothetical protein [Neobacillus sp. PS2-9]WML58960.1 hypothetical protein RCG25_03940 [Neobacillus sp. PS2-9]